MTIQRLALCSRSRGAAFSLVEVMMAMVIAGVMLLSLYAGFSFGFAVVQLARENLRATQILQEKMETIRLYHWTQIHTPGFLPETFTESFYPEKVSGTGLIYTGKVTVAAAPLTESYGNQMREVIVDLEWKSAGVKRTRTMRTFISQYGLQHYVY